MWALGQNWDVIGAVIVSVISVALLFLASWYFSHPTLERQVTYTSVMMGLAAMNYSSPDKLDEARLAVERILADTELAAGTSRAPIKKEKADKTPQPQRARTAHGKELMQGFLTLLVLVTALYVLIVKADSDTGLKNWAYGVIGTLLGFWLKR